MELATIVIDPEEAKARADEYAEAFKRERRHQDAAMAQGYRAAARGLPIIRLTQAISDGGAFDSGLPRLAVARADSKTCQVEVGTQTVCYYSDPTHWPQNRGAMIGKQHVLVGVRLNDPVKYVRRHQTIVPAVPPRHRPKRYRLSGCHVLWEVEKWEMIPPVDPALIRHIGGDLWSVLAVWDLSELERAVLAQRR